MDDSLATISMDVINQDLIKLHQNNKLFRNHELVLINLESKCKLKAPIFCSYDDKLVFKFKVLIEIINFLNN